MVRVLVVEDERQLAAGLRDGLEAEGFAVDVAADGLDVVGGAGSVMVSGADGDAPLTGEQRDKAVAAAKAHVGEGQVTDTEIGDDGAAYGVEIRKPDGAQVEVNLDQDYGSPAPKPMTTARTATPTSRRMTTTKGLSPSTSGFPPVYTR